MATNRRGIHWSIRHHGDLARCRRRGRPDTIAGDPAGDGPVSATSFGPPTPARGRRLRSVPPSGRRSVAVKRGGDGEARGVATTVGPVSRPMFTKILLDGSSCPQWYSVIPDLPVPPPATAPWHPSAGRAGGSGTAVPDGADRAGGHRRRRHPRRRARRVPPVAADPVPGAPLVAARHPAHLLQVRGRQPGRSPNPTPCRRRTTTTRRRAQAHHRDGCRAGGVRWRSPPPSTASSARSGGRAPRKPYRKTMMEVWGATSPAVADHRVRAAAGGEPRSPAPGIASRGGGDGCRRPRRATPSAACSTTCCCTRR